MPPPKAANHSGGVGGSTTTHTISNNNNKTKKLIAKYVSVEYVKYLVLDPAALPIVTVLILLAELLINVFVINRVPYTEIDWRAYMQECEGFLNGTTDYALLKGDTGPLVYPAGFVYIYSALYYVTAHGSNLRVAQYIFAVIYLLQMWLVLRLYAKSRKVPPYVLAISAFTSYRVHSIYVLRLFNDPVAVLLLYAALNLFLDRRWTWGSVCFSLGVGVKMNILLFAPALLLFYITNLGYVRTALQLTVCGCLQLLLGAPFLLTYPLAYLKGSFDLGRIFEHKWTVNYRFLPPALFEHRLFHLALLMLHVLLLLAFAKPVHTFFTSYTRLRALQQQLLPQLQRRNKQLKREKETAKQSKSKPKATKTKATAPTPTPTPTPANDEPLTQDQENFLKSFEKTLQRSTGLKGPMSPPPPPPPTEAATLNDTSGHEPVSIHFDQCAQLALLPFFLCNFIGVLCARSLHYQFYIWYFHSLPYLTWCTGYSLGVRFLLLGLIELCWNTYPSTVFSSALLHACHALLVFGVGRVLYKQTRQGETMRRMRPKAKDN